MKTKKVALLLFGCIALTCSTLSGAVSFNGKITNVSAGTLLTSVTAKDGSGASMSCLVAPNDPNRSSLAAVVAAARVIGNTVTITCDEYSVLTIISSPL